MAEIISNGSDTSKRDKKIARQIVQQVSEDVWWDSEYGQQTLHDVSESMYKRAQRLGIAEHPLARAGWRNLGHGEV